MEGWKEVLTKKPPSGLLLSWSWQNENPRWTREEGYGGSKDKTQDWASARKKKTCMIASSPAGQSDAESAKTTTQIVKDALAV